MAPTKYSLRSGKRRCYVFPREKFETISAIFTKPVINDNCIEYGFDNNTRTSWWELSERIGDYGIFRCISSMGITLQLCKVSDNVKGANPVMTADAAIFHGPNLILESKFDFGQIPENENHQALQAFNKVVDDEQAKLEKLYGEYLV